MSKEGHCDFCKKYQHFSFKNEDPEKRGKPQYVNGLLVPRPARQVVKCDGCPVESHKWTVENKDIYARWRVYQMGYGEIDYRLAWAFFRLSEAEREIERKLNGNY